MALNFTLPSVVQVHAQLVEAGVTVKGGSHSPWKHSVEEVEAAGWAVAAEMKPYVSDPADVAFLTDLLQPVLSDQEQQRLVKAGVFGKVCLEAGGTRALFRFYNWRRWLLLSPVESKTCTLRIPGQDRKSRAPPSVISEI